ncbi:MAG: DciA family protein [Ilumatobacteraceae bacterium]
MSQAGDDPMPLSAALDSVLRSLRGPDREEAGGVFGRWEDAVGETVARHVTPVRLSEGILLVEVDEPAWATQFEFMAGEVRRRLAEVLNVNVERIDVRVAGRRR